LKKIRINDTEAKQHFCNLRMFLKSEMVRKKNTFYNSGIQSELFFKFSVLYGLLLE